MLRPSHGRSILAVVEVICLANTLAVAQTTVTVQLLGGNSFSPADVTIQVGDTVRWEWVAGNHNVESGAVVSGFGVPDGNFRSGNPTSMGGTNYDLVFDQAFLDAKPMAGNVYPYYCDPHAGVGMIGSVTVQAAVACSSNADCGDADPCNGVETCQSASCVSGTALSCDDGNACTDDSCDVSTGCSNIADDTNACDDGNGCTSNDACSSGSCAGAPSASCCQSDADCDDADACTEDTCESGACAHAAIADCGGGTSDTGTGDTGTGDSGTGEGGHSTTESTIPSGLCGAMGMIPLAFSFFGLCVARTTRRRSAQQG